MSGSCRSLLLRPFKNLLADSDDADGGCGAAFFFLAVLVRPIVSVEITVGLAVVAVVVVAVVVDAVVDVLATDVVVFVEEAGAVEASVVFVDGAFLAGDEAD